VAGSPQTGLAGPEYLSIDGHRDCLGSFQPNVPITTEWFYCMPKAKPKQCEEWEWEALKEKFTGEDCPEVVVDGQSVL
jgi:hypothetical protein